MKTSLPDYSLPDLSGSYINQLGQFENILEEANNIGIVNNTPGDANETYNVEDQRIRLQTITSRLWLLGYLPRKISHRNIKNKIDDIKHAVVQFQKDANLIQDEWVGDKTWYALDELVSFESDITYNKWFVNGRIRSKVKNSFHRAIQLRLWSLGLYGSKPKKNSKLLNKKDIRNFGKILKIFLIKNNKFEDDFNYETLQILFDQDLLTKAIAERSSKNRKTFLLKLPIKEKESQRRLAQRFIVNCAKIELWLLGYKVKIDGKFNFEISEESDMYVAISLYYKHFQDLSESQANKFAKRITPDLFVGIEAANNINYEDGDDASKEIIMSLKTNNDVNNAWTYIKDKGMRLWDGVKRLWRWFKKIGSKIVSFFKENIFKAFFRYTSKASKIIKKGVAEVVRSIKVYITGDLIVNNIRYQFSKDMDTIVLLPKDANISETELGINKLLKQSKAFNVGCRIIAWIFRIFKYLVVGFVGWAKLLIALLKGYKDLKRLYFDFKQLATE